MTKKFLKSFFLLLTLSVFLFSCIAQQVQKPEAKSPMAFSPHQFDLNQYEQKVNNFIVLFDASFSMRSNYGKDWKFIQAKEFVSRMNQTIPDLDLTAGLRSFGHHPDVSNKKTVLLYGMTNYTKKGIDDSLTVLKWPGGETPMAAVIDAATNDLESTQGKIAVIIVSDAVKALIDRDPVPAAKAMAGRYGDRLCIYSVLVGDDPEGKDLLEKISQASTCGFSANMEDLMSSQAMADFVERVFLAKRTEPEPKPAVKPEPAATPLDSDGDGVLNDRDQCPDTPAGATVDERGCWVVKNFEFDFDKYNIKEQYYPSLNAVADILRDNPALKVEIAGHTDGIGTAQYNQGLSERRAHAVKAYLVSKGIPSYQLQAAGYGETMPIDSNATDAGRANNRRVELTPIK